MLARLALLFVIVPLLELALLIQMGRWVGFWPTFALVLFTGVTGAALARAEGLRTLAAFQREVSAGRLPGQSLLDGLAVLVGGAFLLTPGLLTDVAGFALLVPPARRWLQRRGRAWLERRIESGELNVHVWTPGGPGGFGAWGGGGSPWGGGPDEPPSDPRPLDPRNEILPPDDPD